MGRALEFADFQAKLNRDYHSATQRMDDSQGQKRHKQIKIKVHKYLHDKIYFRQKQSK